MASREANGVGETHRHKTHRSTRAPCRPPTTASRASTGIYIGAGRATSPDIDWRTLVLQHYIEATTRRPKLGRAGRRRTVPLQSPTSVQEEGPRSSMC